jgi:hypothetical protein
MPRIAGVEVYVILGTSYRPEGWCKIHNFRSTKSVRLAGGGQENRLSGAQLSLAVACTVSPGGIFTGDPVVVMVSAATVMC